MRLEEKIEALKIWFQKKSSFINIYWKNKKKCKRPIRCKMGDVFWADLGINIGAEIDKARPVVVFQGKNRWLDGSDTVFVFPITSNLSIKKFKILIDSSAVGNLKAGGILLDQGRVISKTRLQKYFGRLDSKILESMALEFQNFCFRGTDIQDKFISPPPAKLGGENSQTFPKKGNRATS